MSSLPHAAFRGCKFLLEAAKSTARSPKAAATSSIGASKNKAAAAASSKSKKSTSAEAVKQKGRSLSAKPTGILKVTPVSPTLHSFLGVSETCRSDAVKRIWDYIKLHNLQNPMNKREINCDHKLKALFGGKEKVGFLEISKLLSPHFLKPS